MTGEDTPAGGEAGDGGADGWDRALERHRATRALRRGEAAEVGKTPIGDLAETEPAPDDDPDADAGDAEDPEGSPDATGPVTADELAALGSEAIEVYAALVEANPAAAHVQDQLLREWGSDYLPNLQFAASILHYLSPNELRAVVSLPAEHAATLWRLGAQLGRRLSGGDLEALRAQGLDAGLYAAAGICCVSWP